jgi:hypothetical protein
LIPLSLLRASAMSKLFCICISVPIDTLSRLPQGRPQATIAGSFVAPVAVLLCGPLGGLLGLLQRPEGGTVAWVLMAVCGSKNVPHFTRLSYLFYLI